MTLIAQPTKKLPEYRVLALPSSAVTRQNNQNFAFMDEMRHLIKRDRSDSTNDEGVDGGAGVVATAIDTLLGLLGGEPWSEQPEFESLSSSLEYIEFGETVQEGAAAVVGKDGSTGGVGGLTLKGRTVPVNCRATREKGRAPGGKAGAPSLTFRQKKPTGDEVVVETVRPVDREHTSVQITTSLPNRTVELETEERLEANQSFKAEFGWICRASGHEGLAAARVAWAGNRWSLCLREDGHGFIVPALDVWNGRQWREMRKFEAAKFREWSGTTTVLIRRLGGRIVVTLTTGKTTQSFEFLRPRTAAPDLPTRDFSLPTISWPKGKLTVTSFGVRLRVGVDLLTFKKANGKPQTGKFTRRIQRSLRTPIRTLDIVGEAPTDANLHLSVGGWRSKATPIRKEATLDYNGLVYTLTMAASANGHDAPFVSTVIGRFVGDEESEEGDPLDVTSAFLRGDMDAASPEAGASGNVLTLHFSRNLLHDLSHETGDDWQEFLQQYRLLRFEVRWGLSDDTHSEWATLGEFYIEDVPMESPGPNDWLISFTCHDPVLRLIAPHSLVDYRYLPDLAFLLAFKNGGRGGSLYGGECIQYLISVELGQEEASRLNGNGDPQRFFDPDHYPLLTSETDRLGYYFAADGPNAPTHSGPILGAPRWGCSDHEWMQKIGTDDFGVFFYAPEFGPLEPDVPGSPLVPQNGGRPVPVYANWNVWVAQTPTWNLSDDDYNPGDLDFIIKSMQTLRRGNGNYNAAQAWWSPPDARGNYLPVPAAQIAEARLDASDPNAEEHSWRRTYQIEDAQLWYPGAIRSFVLQFMAGLAGISIEYPTIHLRRGDARIWWGHKATIRLGNTDSPLTGNGSGKYSDPDFAWDGKTFRILKVRHSFVNDKKGPDAFSTTLSLFPLLNYEQ